MEVITAGATGGAIGNIFAGTGTVTSGTPAQVYARVTDGNNQSLMALYTVPADKYAFIGEYYANTGKSGEAIIDSMFRLDGGSGDKVFQNKRKIYLYENTFRFNNNYPFFLPPKTDIEIRAATVSVSTPISAGFDIILLDANSPLVQG